MQQAALAFAAFFAAGVIGWGVVALIRMAFTPAMFALLAFVAYNTEAGRWLFGMMWYSPAATIAAIIGIGLGLTAPSVIRRKR